MGIYLVLLVILEINTININYRLINNNAILEIFKIKYKLDIS